MSWSAPAGVAPYPDFWAAAAAKNQEEKSRKRQTSGGGTEDPAAAAEASKARKLKATKLFHLLDRYRVKTADAMARIRDVIDDMSGDISGEFAHHCSDSDAELDAHGKPIEGKRRSGEKEDATAAQPAAVNCK